MTIFFPLFIFSCLKKKDISRLFVGGHEVVNWRMSGKICVFIIGTCTQSCRVFNNKKLCLHFHFAFSLKLFTRSDIELFSFFLFFLWNQISQKLCIKVEWIKRFFFKIKLRKFFSFFSSSSCAWYLKRREIYFFILILLLCQKENLRGSKICLKFIYGEDEARECTFENKINKH